MNVATKDLKDFTHEELVDMAMDDITNNVPVGKIREVIDQVCQISRLSGYHQGVDAGMEEAAKVASAVNEAEGG